MLTEKIIEIEPFAETNLKSCLLHGIFSIMNQHQKSIVPFLFNYIFKYGPNENGNKINIKVQINQINELGKIFRESNVQVNKKGKSTNILQDIKTAIENNYYVIVYADPYFMPGNAKFRKKHIIHCFLVYGFNDNDQTFNILDVVENPFPNGYEKKILSYDGLKSAYEGYVERYYEEEKKETYFEYFIENDEPENIVKGEFSGIEMFYIKEFVSKMLENKKSIMNGLDSLLTFIDEYKTLVSNETLYKETSNELYDTTHDILHDKLTDRYRLIRLFGQDHEIIKTLDAIINRYIYLRAVIGRYKHTSIYNTKNIIASVNKLESIHDYEVKYHNLLFNSLEEIVIRKFSL